MGRVVPLLLCGMFLAGAPALAQGDSATMTASVDGQQFGDNRVVLDPSGSRKVAVTVHNGSAETRQARVIRLSGGAFGLEFFSYETTVPFEVPGRTSVTRAFVLDMAGLEGKATGLVPVRLELLDDRREVIASRGSTADVRGSVLSVYGVAGLVLLVLAVAAWSAALWAAVKGVLPPRRSRRALQFVPAGVATGLAAVVWSSVLRVLTPQPAVAAVVVVVLVVAAMVVGYLAPSQQAVARAEEDGAGSSGPVPAVVRGAEDDGAQGGAQGVRRGGAGETATIAPVGGGGEESAGAQADGARGASGGAAGQPGHAGQQGHAGGGPAAGAQPGGGQAAPARPGAPVVPAQGGPGGAAAQSGPQPGAGRQVPAQGGDQATTKFQAVQVAPTKPVVQTAPAEITSPADSEATQRIRPVGTPMQAPTPGSAEATQRIRPVGDQGKRR
ncbi:hypothetical protein [Actinosynnema mirum]|uniref:PE-PGRS family protein n=1 Tax=Actinosynnema mirum (strain ATCC 29888 / DSM 43827 / JCM 3225 / NBRC 14064 / NCIMB 13271 / NRRL B-12336 / IMRU 3971 / 101) TaxID=446462 RepID=C6W8G7_ACTMD|nr:hypothetical protein [Actinosynnema mirum]ACU39014.1 hypothetical protein Amir_5193 [Actinosynnema mirum DSM 43827]